MTPLASRLSLVVQEVLPFLIDLEIQGADPLQASPSLASLRQRLPDVTLRLHSEREQVSGDYQHEALIESAGEAVVSLSVCLKDSLPWPMRSAQYWHESHVVKVNHQVLAMDEAISLLETSLRDARVSDSFINSCLVREEVERSGVDPSAEQVQRALDAFRRTHGLLSAASTHAWLERRGLRAADLERTAREYATVFELKRRIADGRVDEYFEARRDRFDVASVLRLRYASEGEALLARELLAAGRFDTARLLMDIESSMAGDAGAADCTLSRVERDGSASSRRVFSATDNVTEPAAVEGGFEIAVILGIRKAVLDSTLRARIVDELFDAWLEERRSTAEITWYWGDPSRIRGA